jgi:hypothetical protein
MGARNCYRVIFTRIVVRVTNSSEPDAFHCLFDYLEDNTIIKDKAGMWSCIAAVAEKCFQLFLEVKKQNVSFTILI